MPGFGSVTYNAITIHHMEGSTIQQAGAQSHLTQNVSYGPQDTDDLRRALDLLEKHFDELALDAKAKQRALAQVATLRAQLTDEPDPVIMKQAGKTLRNVTEGAIAGLITTAVQPTVWQFIGDVFGRLFGG